MGLAAATMLATTAPVGAAQAQSLGQNLFQKMFGTTGANPEINYSERAPLVMPNRRDLQSPGKAKSAENDPNWPDDPDEKKRRQADLPEPRVSPNGNNLLSSEEMKAGTLRHASAEESFRSTDSREVEHDSRPLKPSELQKRLNFGPNSDNTPLAPGQEPPRHSLTDPPTGYRAPLASAPLNGDEPLPSEAGQDKPWYERLWRTSNNH
ncbi:hypothetical protein [Labrys monachus]|uniref:Uncharacterized protein n=1 Tax=Labrys monachus TaxID=217067 RepID=A0ABU0FKG3_9HYPH|nr:hypothetical protein [Labrys monachus]MDQ0394981.1 hypothetical protein [Labrys monachus]